MTKFDATKCSSLIIAALCGLIADQAFAVQPTIPAPDEAVFAVIHVDVAPTDVTAALPILKSFAQKAKSDPAVSSLQVLQQAGAANHFTLIEVLRSRQMYDQFVQEGYVKAMRAQLQPMLGSPFDERLHGLVPGVSE